MNLIEREQLIQGLFSLGLTHKDIKNCLAQFGYVISERHLSRLLNNAGLYRRRYSDIEDVVLFIHRQLQSSGKLHGYRWMHQKVILNGLNVRKEDVRLILSCLDPESVAFR